LLFQEQSDRRKPDPELWQRNKGFPLAEEAFVTLPRGEWGTPKAFILNKKRNENCPLL